MPTTCSLKCLLSISPALKELTLIQQNTHKYNEIDCYTSEEPGLAAGEPRKNLTSLAAIEFILQ